MTHSRHGSVSKCVGAGLCALALVLHLAFAPVRARAFAGVLPAVAAGTVVTAFLMASGIYPYCEEQAEFADYVSDNLSALWSQYLEWRTEQSLDPPVTGNELSSLTGYLTQGVVAISRSVWDTLSDFVTWVVNYFSVTDNQTSIQLGAVVSGYNVPYFSSIPSWASLTASGFKYMTVPGGVDLFSGASVPDVFAFGYYTESSVAYVFVSKAQPSSWYRTQSYSNAPVDTISLNRSGSLDGISYYFYLNTSPTSYTLHSPLFSTFSEGIYYYLGVTSSFSGVTADTTTVSALPALSSDTPWGGLAVEGVGASATVGAVEHVIQDGVTDREKPEVKVVDVKIQAGTDVDTETGEVTENPVVVSPDVVIPAVSELTAPQAFLDALTTTLQTKFPFCLPFDIMRILQAFVKEPQAPLISLTFHDVFSDSDYTVSVDLSPWNDVAIIVRQFESMLLLLGFWLNFDKFNVLNIILGQLG